jgi:hypothetical protein
VQPLIGAAVDPDKAHEVGSEKKNPSVTRFSTFNPYWFLSGIWVVSSRAQFLFLRADD